MSRPTEILVTSLQLIKHGRPQDAGRYAECRSTTAVNQGDMVVAYDRRSDSRLVGRVTELKEQGWIVIDTFAGHLTDRTNEKR